MTREPLMLSDTAMVLLREYIQVERDEKMLLDAILPVDRPVKLPINGGELQSVSLRRTQLQTEILRDIWLIWAYPDIQIVRHLNAHVILNDRLLGLCEDTFVYPEENQINRQTRISRYPYVDKALMDALVWAYRQARLSDTQEADEGSL